MLQPEGVIGPWLGALADMEPDLPTVVIVEDHRVTRRFLADNLAADGYEPVEAESAADARRVIEECFPAAAIIDLGLPDRDGLELLRELRQYGWGGGPLDPQLPVLILSGRATELDRVRGFERGCDDYLAKPFSYAELRARLAALLRRAGTRPRPGRIRIGPLDLDPFSRVVRLDGTPVHLSKKEFGLLRALATEPARVFTREELLEEVWGFQAHVPTRTLDSHASRLRQKLRASGCRFIVNVWGVGYRLLDGELKP
jgi:DNA-binding response OmpR family regulator